MRFCTSKCETCDSNHLQAYVFYANFYVNFYANFYANFYVR